MSEPKLSEHIERHIDKYLDAYVPSGWVDLAEELEARLSSEIESRDGWKEAWKKSEARLSKMEEALTEVHVSIIEGGRMMGHLERVAEEALAGESDV